MNEQAYKQGHKRGYAEGYEIGKQDGYEDGKADTPFTDTEEAENKVYNRGYQDGVEDGAKSVENWNACERKLRTDEAYNRGLNDAWDAARKIIEPTYDGGYGFYDLHEIFGETAIQAIFKHNTATEAITKIRAYEDKHKNDVGIRVGDEVIIHDTDGIEVAKALVLSIRGEGYGIISSNETLTWAHKKFVKKTDKHYSQIAEVLSELRGEDE